MKNINLHIQEPRQISGRINSNRSTPRHIIVEWSKVKEKARILKAVREKRKVIFNMIKNWHLIRNYGGQKAVGYYIQERKEKGQLRHFSKTMLQK